MGWRTVGGVRAGACLARGDYLAVRSCAAARAASSARVVIPSLAKMWDRCTLTVPGAMNRRWAIASFRRPSLTRRTTSSSAGVRLAQPVAVVGDAVFAGSMGGGGVSYAAALETNQKEILTLPDATILCSGHGPLTTVGEQKKHNPFFASSFA